jgi:hypothetical protein
MKLLFQPDPFEDNNNDYIELDPIEITDFEEGTQGAIILTLEGIKSEGYYGNGTIAVWDIKDIQSTIQEFWNKGIIPISWRNN